MRWLEIRVVVLGIALLAGTSCGKDEHHGPDMRTPPPNPEETRTPAPSPTPLAAAPGEPPPVPPPAPAAPRADEPRPTAPAAPATPAIPVKAATPLEKTISVTVDYTGQTVGSKTVEVRARVEGYLLSIEFTEGSFVEEGDLLYEIDKERATEAVEQAVGELNIAKANLGKARKDVARYEPLVRQNAISREEYESAVAAEEAARAAVDAAQAAANRARIQFGYTTVRAPMSGLIGKTEVDVGNLVGRLEATLLTTISKVDPIYVNVRLSEVDFLAYERKRRERGGVAASEISLFLSDDSEHPHQGTVAVVDRNVDPASGTLLVRLSFPNPDRRVRPGQFARVRGVRERIENALLVPQGAVEELQGTYQVYVVGEGDVVEVRPVKVGSRQGGLWVISEGLRAGDRVIVEGRQKVRAGVRVAPQTVPIADPSAPRGTSSGSSR
jgi:membrane fusion protein (multidrug efflux system)